jgi:selenocysteine lyase/cysteine desulfurase
LAAVQEYEYDLSRKLLETLKGVPGLRIYGLDDPGDIQERVPTIAVNLQGMHPHRIAELLDERGIYVWDGNYYAINVTERLGVEDSGGMVRIGAAHYNTLEEIDRLGEALEDISKE